jgi:uncharacterized protein YdaU (DUF1376 family)
MSQHPFFKLYTSDFMAGTLSMTAAEVGDYIRLLCVLYDHDGQVKNDPYVLRHALRVSRIRDAKTRIGRLLELGKLSVDNLGNIHNGRTDEECGRRATSPESEARRTQSRTPENTMFSSRARDRAKLQLDIFNSNPKGSSSARDSALRRRTNDWDLPPAPGPNGQTPFLQQWKESH